MHQSTRIAASRRLRWGLGSVAALSIGVVTAVMAGAGAGAGTAVAGSPTTLSVDKTVQVGSSTEALAVTGGSRAVYWLSGETTHHFLCTTSCFPIWKPVKAPNGKLTLAKGLSGKLATVSRSVNGKKFKQLTLGGHPLYTFAQDKAGVATGNGLESFGGTWHFVQAAGGSSTNSTPSGSSTPSTSTPTTPTTPSTPTYTYPPGYYSAG